MNDPTPNVQCSRCGVYHWKKLAHTCQEQSLPVDSTWTHVSPNNDAKAHILVGTDCHCRPRVDWNELIIVHNSYDAREHFEAGGIFYNGETE